MHVYGIRFYPRHRSSLVSLWRLGRSIRRNIGGFHSSNLRLFLYPAVGAEARLGHRFVLFTSSRSCFIRTVNAVITSKYGAALAVGNLFLSWPLSPLLARPTLPHCAPRCHVISTERHLKSVTRLLTRAACSTRSSSSTRCHSPKEFFLLPHRAVYLAASTSDSLSFDAVSFRLSTKPRPRDRIATVNAAASEHSSPSSSSASSSARDRSRKCQHRAPKKSIRLAEVSTRWKTPFASDNVRARSL